MSGIEIVCCEWFGGEYLFVILHCLLILAVDKRTPAYSTPCFDTIAFDEIKLEEILQSLFISFQFGKAASGVEKDIMAFRLDCLHFLIVFQCRGKVPYLPVARSEMADCPDMVGL